MIHCRIFNTLHFSQRLLISMIKASTAAVVITATVFCGLASCVEGVVLDNAVEGKHKKKGNAKHHRLNMKGGARYIDFDENGHSKLYHPVSLDK
jgi:hypothetical protein